ncbi:glycosyltransferase family 2 protein [Bordetella genomosp. 2]|uniref:Glycosyl transferase family 2 n=1 Tax=Bordetella genomosp. 2 TaxID=1983456 RepID=A0A261VNR8_9BORD|nr:glycosyltransferase family A protein [Bordetella genomosp. 2]OZI75774.1 glycosyl transferase family 2 [Bordetella genomosp. 2]
MSTQAEPILVSVVVPTYRRPQLLERCLQALLAQDFPADAYEIIVCDDADSPQTRRQVRELAAAAGGAPALRYLAATGTRGPAAARNLGWRHARGRIIAFTDDDTIADPDWLGQGVLALRPGIQAAAGRTDMPIPEIPTDYERDAAGLTRSEFITANCFVRRGALEEVGGFDQRYTMAWREDSDLFFALLERGMEVVRAPAARVLHPLRPAPFAAGLGMQKKVMFDVLLYRKYPRLYRARVRQGPPWFYLSVALSLVAALAAAAAGYWIAAAVLGGIWLALTGYFFARRLAGVSHAPWHVAELALTSAAIPLLSIGWRLVGAARYGARFP